MPNSMADYSSYGDSWDDSVCVRESRGCKLYVYDEMSMRIVLIF